jgi:hypothetical protein
MTERMRALVRKSLPPTLLVAVLLLTSCAAGPNVEEGAADASGQVAGFWPGLWHGIIAPVTFVISLFSNTVNVYEVHNNGNWYNFGFILGAGMFLGGSGASARRRKS